MSSTETDKHSLLEIFCGLLPLYLHWNWCFIVVSVWSYIALKCKGGKTQVEGTFLGSVCIIVQKRVCSNLLSLFLYFSFCREPMVKRSIWAVTYL